MSGLADIGNLDSDHVSSIGDLLSESDSLRKSRVEAFQAFQELPVDNDALFYKYTNFRNIDFKELALPGVEAPLDESGDAFEIYTKMPKYAELMSESSAIVFENEYGQSFIHVRPDLLENGLICGSFAEIYKKDPDLALSIFSGELFQPRNDKLAALNEAIRRNKIGIHVPKEMVLEDPIRIFSIISTEKIIASSCLNVKMAPFASAKITHEIFSHPSSNLTAPSLFNHVQEIYLHDMSSLQLTSAQNLSNQVVFTVNRRANVEKNAVIKSFSHNQGGTITRQMNEYYMNGVGSSAYDFFSTLGNENQIFDIKSELLHFGEHTIGQTHSRSVMMDRSRSTLRGLIRIHKDAKHADSWLTSTNLVVEKGQANAIPALFIDNRDVKAAHAASVSQLEENLYFYLGCRGIPREVAKKVLLVGFLEPVIKLLKNNFSANLVRQYVDVKWHRTLDDENSTDSQKVVQFFTNHDLAEYHKSAERWLDYV